MAEHQGMYDATIRVIDGQPRLGFVQGGEWVELGRAVLAMTEHDDGTGAYKMVWILVDEQER